MIQKRRHARGDYQKESVCLKLRIRKFNPAISPPRITNTAPLLNLIEIDLHDATKISLLLEVHLPRGVVAHIAIKCTSRAWG